MIASKPRGLASLGLLAGLATLPACDTLIGQRVHGTMLEMKADGARISQYPPAHCSAPGYRATFHPGPGVDVTLSNDFGSSLIAARLEVELAAGSRFAFTANTARVLLPDGGPGPEAKFGMQSVRRNSHSGWESVQPAAEMLGNAPAGDHSTFDGMLSARGVPATGFSLQLPDALVNGAPYRFPAIQFTPRDFSFFQDACLR